MIVTDYKKNNQTYRQIIYDDCFDIRNTPITNENNERHYRDSVTEKDGDMEWFGIRNGAKGVFNACEKSWAPGYEKASTIAGQMPPLRLESVRRKHRWTEFGNELDIHRVLSGNLSRSWRDCKRTSRLGRKKILLVVDICAACNRKADEMFWTGAVATLLAKSLIESGQIVSVVCAWQVSDLHMHGSSPIYRFAATVKPFGSQMAPETLVAYTALGGFFRVYGFKAMLNIPEICNWGLGRVMDLDGGFDYYEQNNVTQIVIPRVWTREAAVKLLNEKREEIYGTSKKAA